MGEFILAVPPSLLPRRAAPLVRTQKRASTKWERPSHNVWACNVIESNLWPQQASTQNCDLVTKSRELLYGAGGHLPYFLYKT